MHFKIVTALELRHDLSEVLRTGPKFKQEGKQGVEHEANRSLDSPLSQALFPYTNPNYGVRSALTSGTSSTFNTVEFKYL